MTDSTNPSVATTIPIFNKPMKSKDGFSLEATNITIDGKDSRSAPLCDEDALKQKIKEHKLPEQVQAFLEEHGGIGRLMKEVVKYNSRVDISMAYVLVLDWAYGELGLNNTELEKTVEEKLKVLKEENGFSVKVEDGTQFLATRKNNLP